MLCSNSTMSIFFEKLHFWYWLLITYKLFVTKKTKQNKKFYYWLIFIIQGGQHYLCKENRTKFQFNSWVCDTYFCTHIFLFNFSLHCKQTWSTDVITEFLLLTAYMCLSQPTWVFIKQLFTPIFIGICISLQSTTWVFLKQYLTPNFIRICIALKSTTWVFIK